MLRRLIALNVVLGVLIACVVMKLRWDIRSFSSSHRVEDIRSRTTKPLTKTVAPPATSSTADNWTDIAARNPFSIDRSDVAIVAASATAQAQRRPKPILFGTMTIGQDRLAMLGPGDSPNRATRPSRIGESFDGWTIMEIGEKSAVLGWGEVKETIIMNDPTALQIARGTDKTNGVAAAMPAPATAVQPSPAQPMESETTGNAASRNPATGKKQIMVHTPFGDKVIDEPSQ